MSSGLHFAALMLYGTATAVLAVSFARSDQRLPRVAAATLGAGALVHAGALASFTAEWGELPLVGLAPSLSTLGFLVALGTLIAMTLTPARTVGLVLVPVVSLLTGIAMGVGLTPSGEPIAFRGGWFALHVVAAFVGYAGLTVAFAAGLMYLLQFRELKSRHFGAIFRFFPPLQTLDRLGSAGVLIGFPFLTLALLIGWAWTARFAGPSGPGATKLAWVIVSWLVFAAAIVARWGGGRSGRRGAVVSVLGFVVVVLVYVVARVQAVHGGLFL